MSDFDYFEFYELTDEIEKYLGILKGHELVREYSDQCFQLYDPVVFLFWDSPAKEYGFQFHGLVAPDYRDDVSAHHKAIEQLKKNWKQCFDNGVAWAAGIGGYLRDLCADLTIPDKETLKGSVQEFSDSVVALESVIPVTWTDLDFNSWIGESSDACETIVEDFHHKFRNEYAFYFAYAQAVYAGAGALVIQTQSGLNTTMTGIRDLLITQLQAWQESSGHWPPDRKPTPPWVANVTGIIGGVLDLIPVVSEVKGKVETVVGIGKEALELMDVEVGGSASEAFTAMKAEQIYTTTTTTLQDDYMKKMRDGLDQLRTERANAVVAAQEAIDPWLMESLAGIDSEPWQHENEDV